MRARTIDSQTDGVLNGGLRRRANFNDEIAFFFLCLERSPRKRGEDDRSRLLTPWFPGVVFFQVGLSLRLGYCTCTYIITSYLITGEEQVLRRPGGKQR